MAAPVDPCYVDKLQLGAIGCTNDLVAPMVNPTLFQIQLRLPCSDNRHVCSLSVGCAAGAFEQQGADITCDTGRVRFARVSSAAEVGPGQHAGVHVRVTHRELQPFRGERKALG